jgi:hypothetical protein
MEKRVGSCDTDDTLGTGNRGRDKFLKVAKSEATKGNDFNTARTEMFNGMPRGKEASIILKLKTVPPSDSGRATTRVFIKRASINSTSPRRASNTVLNITVSNCATTSSIWTLGTTGMTNVYTGEKELVPNEPFNIAHAKNIFPREKDAGNSSKVTEGNPRKGKSNVFLWSILQNAPSPQVLEFKEKIICNLVKISAKPTKGNVQLKKEQLGDEEFKNGRNDVNKESEGMGQVPLQKDLICPRSSPLGFKTV